MSYNGCKCARDCKDFRDHVGFGPMVDGKAMPTRSRATQLQATEDQWERDGDALHRLGREGHDIPILDGAADLESRATQPIELKHGKVYGPAKAKMMQEIADSAVVVSP